MKWVRDGRGVGGRTEGEGGLRAVEGTVVSRYRPGEAATSASTSEVAWVGHGEGGKG